MRNYFPDSYRFLLLIVFAFFSLLPVGTILYFENTTQQDALLLNLSGAQRMLSQRIALLLTLLDTSAPDAPLQREEIEASLSRFESAHRFLTSEEVPKEISSLYGTGKGSTSELVERYIRLANSSLQKNDGKNLKSLVQLETRLLEELDLVVDSYQEYVDGRRASILILFLVLFFADILIVIFVYLYLILSSRRQLDRSGEKLDISMKQLKSSENLFKATISSMFDALVVIDRHGTVRFVNAATSRIFGYEAGEVTGKNISLLMPSPVKEAHDGYLRHYGETGEARIIGTGREVTGRHRDGSPIILDLAISEGETESEKIYIGVLRDISKRKELETEIFRMRQIHSQGERIARLGSWEWEIGTGQVRWSDEIYRILGRNVGSLEPSYKAYLSIIHPEDRDEVKKAMMYAYRRKTSFLLEHRVLLPNGAIRYLHSQGIAILNEKKKVVSIAGTLQDVTEIKTARDHLARTNETLNRYISIVDENVITSSTNLRGVITSVSNAFCRISGYSREELVGKSHNIVRHPDMPQAVYKELWETIQQDNVWSGEIKNRCKDGSSYWVDVVITPVFNSEGEKTEYTAVRQDITDKKRIEELSITDEMTGLYNRRYFNSLFPERLRQAARSNGVFAFVLVDVDHFKKYNDTYGHPKGDDVLIAIAGVFKEHLKRSVDGAFRLGGEEFGLLFLARSREDIEDFIEKIRISIVQLNIEHSENLPGKLVTASFGAALLDFRQGYEIQIDQEDLYRKADEALYRAKKEGRNRYVIDLDTEKRTDRKGE